MPLTWFRVDTGIGQHDKILELTGDTHTSPANRYRAAFAYIAALGWAVEQGTDGRIPPGALPINHANETTAKLLVAHRLWIPVDGGWQIRNYELRQQTSATTDQRRLEGQRAACIRWHEPDCWIDGKGCTRNP